MVPKPDKPAHDVASYRPISLLPIPSKVFEKLLLKRLRSDVDLSHFILDYQFGFRPGYSPIQQAHSIVNTIVTSLRNAHCGRRSSLPSPRRSTKCGTSACCINWRSPSQAHTICSCSRTLPTVTSRSGIMACALTATRWDPVSPRAVFLAPCSTYFSPPIYLRQTTTPSRLLRTTRAPGGASWSCPRIPAPSEPLNPPPQLFHIVENTCQPGEVCTCYLHHTTRYLPSCISAHHTNPSQTRC